MRVRRMGAADRAPMLDLWERSVRATHHFLSEDDIVGLRPRVADALASDAVQWWVLESTAGEPMGFMGFVDPSIEGLFIDPAHFRRGAGTFLVAHAQSLASAPLMLDVNEQNPGAVRFYRALGFRVIGRSPTDTAGRPFPLLHMRRRAVHSTP
ncbi:MAG TPA: GNAT family N-acetyltransferase [Candidatus Krumholzibacteria bacterium]